MDYKNLPGYKRLQERNKPKCPTCHGETFTDEGVTKCRDCGYAVKWVTLNTEQERNVLSRVDITNFVFGTWDHCFYCGEPADQRDHVIPHSMFSMEKTGGEKTGPRTFACKECNCILQDSFFPTLEIRCCKVRDFLLRRHFKIINLPHWTDQELRGMGHSLKAMIKANQSKKNWILNRANWMGSETSKQMWTEAIDQAKLRYPENEWLHNFLFRQL